MQPAVQQYLLQLSEPKMGIAQRVRDIFLANDKVSESIKWNQLTFSVGRKSFAFVYSYPQVEYVNVGFFQATSLADPKNLFEGTGKGMRHVKLYNGEKIPTAQIKAWVREAVLLSSV